MGIFHDDDEITVKIKGKEYALRFSMEAIDAVLDRYGSVEKMDAEIHASDTREVFKAYEWIAALMLKDSCIDAGEEPFTAESLSRKISPKEFIALKYAVNAAIARDLPRSEPEEATQSKN